MDGVAVTEGLLARAAAVADGGVDHVSARIGVRIDDPPAFCYCLAATNIPPFDDQNTLVSTLLHKWTSTR